MSGTICLYHSELPVHTFAFWVCCVTIHSWAVTLPIVNGTSDLFHWWFLWRTINITNLIHVLTIHSELSHPNWPAAARQLGHGHTASAAAVVCMERSRELEQVQSHCTWQWRLRRQKRHWSAGIIASKFNCLHFLTFLLSFMWLTLIACPW